MVYRAKYLSKLAIVTVMAIWFYACNSVKYVPDNQYLLNKTKIQVDNKSINKSDLKTYQKQKPNTRIFGFWKYHLGLYNLSNKNREEGFLKRVGEAPVILSPFLTRKSRAEFEQYMHNKGFYRAIVSDTIVYRKGKKAEVYYNIISNAPHLIESYKTEILDSSMRALNKADSIKSLVKLKGKFDTDILAEESKRILLGFQNQGFYRANKSQIYFEADTTKAPLQVNLKLVVDKENISDDPTVVMEQNHKRYTFRNFYFFTNYDTKKQLYAESPSDSSIARIDTLHIGNQYFISKGKLLYKPELLINLNHIDDKGYYSVDLVERTYNELSLLRLFKLINIRFVETNSVDSLGNPTLDCIIQLTPSVRQAYSVSAEATNASGNFGVTGNLGYQHKNIFHGGELLDINLIGGTEKHKYGTGDSVSTFYSMESGIAAKLTIPKFMLPFKAKNLFKYTTPQTLMNVTYNYQRRPDYTRTIFGASLGYQMKSSDFVTHRFNLIDLNLVKMFAFDSAFVAGIENLYIRSSYTDHSISAWNYSFIRNTQNIQRHTNYSYLWASFETAGNLLWGISRLFNRQAYTTDTLSGPQYHFLGTPFAQYIKTDLEYRKGLILDKYNSVVFRTFGGLVVPFGNSDQVPFERKYYAGGSNGIRAWPVRTLGPGSYKADPNEFPNESGDIKLEANAEYRVKLFGPFEGAVFVDVGNIWSLKDNRPGTEFDFSRFYKEIAIGSGAGLRYDFSFVILRLDMGLKIYNPSKDPGVRWTTAGHLWDKDNVNFTFAVGYPF